MGVSSKPCPTDPPSFRGGVEALAAAINCWAGDAKVFPLSGQASREVTVRNLRYYRAQALLDGPLEGGGYGAKHFLQVAAVRLLQARGLPLSRIRDLLYGRSREELEKVFREGLDELHRPSATRAALTSPATPAASPLPAPGEACSIHGLPAGFALVAPTGAAPSCAQLEAIGRILLTPEPSNPSES